MAENSGELDKKKRNQDCQYIYKYDKLKDKKCKKTAEPGKNVCYWHEEKGGKDVINEMGRELRNLDLIEAYLVDANLKNANLRNSKLQRANLEGADLTDSILNDANLIYANLFHSKLHNSNLRNTDFLDESGKIIQEIDEKYQKAEEVYRDLKINMREEGIFDRMGDLYYNEMRMRGKQLRWFKGRFWNVALYLIAGYGERPRRTLGFWILIIIVPAILYYIFDGIMMNGNLNYDPSFPESLYFSTVTFTTLGYGDLRPKPGWSQACASIEALLGALFMAIIIFVFVRKMIRY